MAQTVESLLQQGYRARREHRHADAKAAYEEALALCDQAKNPAMLVIAIKRLGGIERDLGEIDEALYSYRGAAEICRTLDDPLTLAHTVRHIGDILRQSGQFTQALPSYEEALAIYRAHSETNASITLDLANTLRGFALLQTDLGNIPQSIELWREAGVLYDQVWQEPDSPYEQSDLEPGILESQRQIAALSAL